MRHGSLFSGIGGFDLASEWMGWENVFHCEINEFCQKVLKYYWPNAKSYSDIKTTDFSIWRGKVDIISGGFPCQPYSQAGKRKGKADDRHLWPEMLRAIREIQPCWVVGENVPGLINWSGGMVLKEIKADLEAEGFEILATNIIPACGKNAPHRRDRLWIVAHNNKRDRQEIGLQAGGQKYVDGTEGSGITSHAVNHRHKTGRKEKTETNGVQGIGWQTMDAREFDGADISPNVTNSNSDKRCEGWLHSPERKEAERYAGTFNTWDHGRTWENFPTQPPIRSRNDGIPYELDGITFPKHRTESIKGYGNAIVPQVVLEIFKCIEMMNSDKNDERSVATEAK